MGEFNPPLRADAIGLKPPSSGCIRKNATMPMSERDAMPVSERDNDVQEDHDVREE